MLFISHKEKSHMNLQKICTNLEKDLEKLFEELTSGISQREDSRAFGAMIEEKITTN
jgi:DNA replication initiation complex subunit (GINS family)